MVESGIILLKYWLEVSPDEQTRRLEARIHDGRKIWKLSPMDLKSYSRWYDYSRARDEMFATTDTAWAPWFVVRSDDKKRARLNIISHLLSQIPYKEPRTKKSNFPNARSPETTGNRTTCSSSFPSHTECGIRGKSFDNPDPLVACVVGNGKAETGPLATGWHGNKFLTPWSCSSRQRFWPSSRM